MIKDLNVKNLKTIKKNNEEYLVIPMRIEKSKNTNSYYLNKIYLHYYSDIMMVEAKNYPGATKLANNNLLYSFSNRDLTDFFAPIGLGFGSLFYLNMRNKRDYSRFKSFVLLSIFMLSYLTTMNVIFTLPSDVSFKYYIENDLVGNDKYGKLDKDLCDKVENFLKTPNDKNNSL